MIAPSHSFRTQPDTRTWRTARGPITLVHPFVFGIVNVTPDSFWEQSRTTDFTTAMAHADVLIADGAHGLDIGGVSTRPGAQVVPLADELARVMPVVHACARRWPNVPLSVDTVSAPVARAALADGAWIVNDVSGLRGDADMAAVVAAGHAGLVCMHSRGDITTMASYDLATYGQDPVGDVISELAASLDIAQVAGIPDEAIVLDPGLGFAKHTAHSVALLAELPRIRALGWPVLVGPSRKRFVGELAGGLPVEDRLAGTIAACVAALLGGAMLFRVHDVRAVRHALAVADAIRTHRMH